MYVSHKSSFFVFKKIFIFCFCFPSWFCLGQDWRLIGNEPLGHSPRSCTRCIQNSGQFPRKEHQYQDKRITAYYTSYNNILDDYIVYFDENGNQEKIDVKQLSVIGFPEEISHRNGAKIDLLSCGLTDSKTLVVERKIAPTPNQVVTKRFALPFANISPSSLSEITSLIGEFKLGGKNYPAFVIEIDHSRQNIVLRGGNWGFTRNVKIDEITNGFEVVERLHDDQFKVLKKIGLSFLLQEHEIYKKLHIINPVNVEEEARKEKESFEEGQRIKLYNQLLKNQYEFQRRVWFSLGGDSSSFNAKFPSPNYLVHVQYYAHPEWSEIEKVYGNTHDMLKDKFSDWDNIVEFLPSVALKKGVDGRPTVDQVNKLNSLGSETLEGVYKVLLNETGSSSYYRSSNKMIGELKLYVYPQGEGRFTMKYSTGINDKGKSTNIFYECDFIFEVETSPDKATRELSISSIQPGSRNTGGGRDISDFRFMLNDGLSSGAEELVILLGSKKLKSKRIRDYIIDLDGGFRRKVK